VGPVLYTRERAHGTHTEEFYEVHSGVVQLARA